MDNVYDLLMRGDLEKNETTESRKESFGDSVLGGKHPGEVVEIAGRNFIVLGRECGGVAVIARDIEDYMEFGDENNDYKNSVVRDFCNGPVYEQLVSKIGAENIFKHIVDLRAEDGTGDDVCEDMVSTITTDRYRKYRQYIDPIGLWWWTATKESEYCEDVRIL